MEQGALKDKLTAKEPLSSMNRLTRYIRRRKKRSQNIDALMSSKADLDLSLHGLFCSYIAHWLLNVQVDRQKGEVDLCYGKACLSQNGSSTPEPTVIGSITNISGALLC